MDIITSLFDFDLASLVPKVDTFLGKVELIMRICVLAGPLVLLVLGLVYFFLPPKEANHRFGFRTWFGMGSVQAWRTTQKIAGIVLGGLGLILTVVMVILCAGFRDMELMPMVEKAIGYLLWQIGLAAVAYLGIHITALVLFDNKGNHRWKK